MIRGRRPVVSLVALLTVLASIVLTQPPLPALAEEPSLQEAVAQQKALERTLANQRARLEELNSSRTTLQSTLAEAEAQLAAVAAEYDSVSTQLADVASQIAALQAELDSLIAGIAELDGQLTLVAAQIAEQTIELEQRTALLEAHLRDTYERSQTSLLEIILSADSLDEVTTEVSYLFSVAERDEELADAIREVRAELEVKQQTLADGRRQLDEAKSAAEAQSIELEARRGELADLEARLAQLRAEAQAARDAEATALQQILLDAEETQRIYEQNVAEHAAQEQLITQLQAEAARLEAQRLEAERREQERLAQERAAAAAAEEAEREKERELSARGFRWPMDNFVVTQEFGPTGLVLEPPGCYRGTCYPHYHDGIDIAGPCGTPVLAASAGVVLASGQPNPASDGYGVIISHANGIQTLYWHLSTQVVVQPGQQVLSGDLIGYEGNTGYSTGCHLHFGVNDNGTWENPRNYMP